MSSIEIVNLILMHVELIHLSEYMTVTIYEDNSTQGHTVSDY